MKKVDIYTSANCSYCHAAKEYLNENKIEFTEHNISSDKEARKELMKKGFMSVPVIMIENDVVVGFDKGKIAQLLGI